MNLSVGGNTALSGNIIPIVVTLHGQQVLSDTVGLIWIALDAQQKPVGTPAYLQTPTPWASVEAVDKGALWSLDLEHIPPATNRLILVMYSYASKTTMGQTACQIVIQQQDIQYEPQLNTCTDAAVILLEVYQRNTQWKVRALAESSPLGLAALGRRLELALDEKHPSLGSEHAQDNTQPDFGGISGNEKGSWTGTAFAISPTHLLTCAHVVRGASTIEIDSLQGKHTAQCVTFDTRNDIALLKIQDASLAHILAIELEKAGQLGEAITALGYPLSNMLGNHLQVTQGCVSKLRGFNEDCGFLQFTAPIQPGSSGSPLLNTTGSVVGMVTSSLVEAQNINFAIKHYLLLALLDAAGMDLAPTADDPITPLSHPQLVKQAQHAIWHVSCSGSVS